ncbi:MAG: hypothetical protein R3A52_10555 [Polyangiales bacterium]
MKEVSYVPPLARSAASARAASAYTGRPRAAMIRSRWYCAVA